MVLVEPQLTYFSPMIDRRSPSKRTITRTSSSSASSYRRCSYSSVSRELSRGGRYRARHFTAPRREWSASCWRSEPGCVASVVPRNRRRGKNAWASSRRRGRRRPRFRRLTARNRRARTDGPGFEVSVKPGRLRSANRNVSPSSDEMSELIPFSLASAQPKSVTPPVVVAVRRYDLETKSVYAR